MAAVNLDELEHAALLVDDGEGRATALVARATGMIHLLNDDYMDEEAPLPADPAAGDADYVAVPPASTLGIGDQLVFRFRTEETQTALRRWCDEHGLRVSG